MLRMDVRRNTRAQPSNYNPERAVEAYFAILTIVILGMIVGIVAYTVRAVIPELQRPHSPRSLRNPIDVLFESHSAERH